MSDNNGSSSTFSPADASDKVEFTITIANPCHTVTVPTLTVSGTDSSSPYLKGVNDGSTTTVTFVDPITQVETDTGISAVCGSTSYSIHSANDGTNFSYNAGWAVITGPVSGTYTLTIDTTADLTLIDNEAQKTISVYIKATLDDYTAQTRESYTQVDIQITAAGCVCSALAWDDPSSSVDAGSIAVSTSASTQTLVLPVANTSARSTNAAFDKCYISSQACDEGGAFDSVTWDDGTGATTLPSWITFSSSGTTTQTVAITPPDGTVNGVHSLIAVFNPTNGADKTYTALTFTVTCQVASFTKPSAPTSPSFDLSYVVFETPLTIDVSSLQYVQSPACGYTFTSSYSWGGLTSFMSEAPAGSGTIIVSSSNLSHVSTTSIYFMNTITIASNGPAGSSTFTMTSASDQVGFDVAVTDPCSASTASSTVF